MRTILNRNFVHDAAKQENSMARLRRHYCAGGAVYIGINISNYAHWRVQFAADACLNGTLLVLINTLSWRSITPSFRLLTLSDIATFVGH